MKLPKRPHALVIGGGIAGMCAARALSPEFERVTIIERDRVPTGRQHRAGVPQSRHVHALLLRGLLELERLFPGIEQELTAAGAARMDLGNDVAHCTEWGWQPRAPIEVVPLAMSRLLLETTIRAQLARSMRNLTVLEGIRITGLVATREGERVRVTGVTTSSSELAQIDADLVVDASGRHSKCLELLEAHGVEGPPESVVDAHAGYASRFYELAPDPARWWRGMVIGPKAPSLGRWGLVMPVEQGQSVLTLAGLNRDYPPSDEQGFRAYLESLLSPALAREIERARPVSDIHTYRALANRARHFERWRREVGGFVSLGDSAVAFNASHGQGMSAAAVAANALGDVVSRNAHVDPYALSRSFQREQWARLRTAWDLATGMDLEWPGTSGERPRGYAFKVALSATIARAAHDDLELKKQIGPVLQLMAEPSSLLRPRFIGRVLRAELRHRFGRDASRSAGAHATLAPGASPGEHAAQLSSLRSTASKTSSFVDS